MLLIVSMDPTKIKKVHWSLHLPRQIGIDCNGGFGPVFCLGIYAVPYSARERLVLLRTDPYELRDYAALIYHCGLYVESLQYLKLYQDTMESPTFELKSQLANNLEELGRRCCRRLKLILMEEGWSRQSDSRRTLFNNTDSW